MEIRIETLKTGYLVTECAPTHSPHRVEWQYACGTVSEVTAIVEKILNPPKPLPGLGQPAAPPPPETSVDTPMY